MKTKLLSCCIALMAALQLLAVNDFTVDGIGYVKLGGDSVEVGENASLIGHVTIPANVTYNTKTYRVVGIANWAFHYGKLTSISIPSSLSTIGYGAFEYSFGLTSINIPSNSNLKRIESSAFWQCGNLNSITIPNSVEYLGNEVFSGCTSLTSINIPNTITYIGDEILKGTGITSPVYNNKIFVYLPVSYSGSYTIPNDITIIAGNACEDRKGLTAITYPQSLRKISINAFKGCTNISSIIIPENVDTIARGAFSGCVDMENVYVNAITPPYVSYSNYYEEDKSFSSNPTIHLACGVNYAAYQNSTWSNYNLEYPQPNYTLTLSSNEAQGTINSLRKLACNNDTAIIYAQTNAGYHFTSWSDGNTDNPRTIIMTQDKTLHANFAVSLYTFTATTEDDTKGSVTANNGSYNYGTELTITATPAENYHFDHWKIEKERTLGSLIIAKFSVPDSWTDPYAWIWETGEYGHWEKLSQENGWLVYRTNTDNMHILLVPNGQSFNRQTEDIDITESACYTIDEYSSVTKSHDCISIEDYGAVKDTITTSITENPYTHTLTTNTKVTAIFTTIQYQYCKQCYNGYIYSEYANYAGQGNGGCRSVDAGTTITATVLPNDGYVFQQWADGNTDNPRIFTITQDTTMEAICVRDQSVLTLNVSDEEAGRIFGAGAYDKYTSVQIFAIPNSGYDFVGWSDGNNTNPRYMYLDEEEETLTANFEITSSAQYVVNVTAQNPEQGLATAANYVRLDAIPANGCTFVRWSDGNTDNPRYMELNANIELQAIFEGVPSGVKSASSATQASVRKIIVNDQILVIRGEKTYTLQGQEVK